MNVGASSLEATIARHLAEWEQPHVELAIFGTDNSSTIASTLASFRRCHLHGEIGQAIFYASSIGSVAGLELDDGRRVVLKTHQPGVSLAFLNEVVSLRKHIAGVGGPSPAVLLGPTPLGAGLATVEQFDDSGALCDARQPEIREALAVSFHRIVATLLPFVPSSTLPLQAPPENALWPVPHSRLFDFPATIVGADDIDHVAMLAREAMTPAGVVVIGHGDWRSEHVRFVGTTPAVAYDWDSLRKSHEPALVGSVAHAFCADWSRDNQNQAPTLAEARAFVDEYEGARGEPFSSEERRLCGGAFAYAVAYTARCGHAMGRNERDQSGTFQHLVANHGAELLDV
jgi:hypothetical protein